MYVVCQYSCQALWFLAFQRRFLHGAGPTLLGFFCKLFDIHSLVISTRLRVAATSFPSLPVAIKMNSFILAALCASALLGVSNAGPAAANACGLRTAVGGTDAFNGVMKQCGGPNCNLGDALGFAQLVPSAPLGPPMLTQL